MMMQWTLDVMKQLVLVLHMSFLMKTLLIHQMRQNKMDSSPRPQQMTWRRHQRESWIIQLPLWRVILMDQFILDLMTYQMIWI